MERKSEAGTTSVLIDTSPDLRDQLLQAEVGRLDAVIYTHEHADHVHGIDDLRMIVFNMRARLPVWADAPTGEILLKRFDYAFVRPEGSNYPPILDLELINGDVTISGAGGDITFTPVEVEHGNIQALGFRVADVAYVPDVSHIPQRAWDQLQGLECWIVDALRRDPHPTHSHLAQTLSWIEKAQPKSAVLTNMHNDLDYDTLVAETPENVQPAYDGLRLSFPAP